jgi:hypothetical protein
MLYGEACAEDAWWYAQSRGVKRARRTAWTI